MALEEYVQFSPDQKEECELFDFVPDWSSPATKVPVSGLESIGLGNVIPQIDINKESLNAMTFSFAYQFSGYEDLKDVYDFFDSMQGKHKSFCLPSWTTDLVISSAASSGSSSIVVESVEPNIYVGCNLFFYLGGEYFTRKITNISSLTITLDSTLPVDIEANTPISIIYRVTFAEDFLNLEYITNDKANTTISFIEERREVSQQGENL